MLDNTQPERALLGALMLHNTLFEQVGQINYTHFLAHHNAKIFKICKMLIDSGNAADPITVLDSFARQEDAEEIGGLKYLTSLTFEACSPENFPNYVDLVLDKFKKRQVKLICTDVLNRADTPLKAHDLIHSLSSSLEGLETSVTKSEPLSADELLSPHIDLMSARHEKRIKFVGTGLRDLDAKLGGGFAGGDLVIIAARPAMGKTAMSLSCALNIAQDHGPVLFFSMEMTNNQIIDRVISNMGSIPLQWMRAPDDSDTHWEAYSYATMKVKETPFYVDDQPGQTLVDIRAKARRLNKKRKLSAVFVDYLGLMTGGNQENRNLQIGEFTKGLKVLAKELDCPVVVLSQLNRSLEARANKRPIMADLRDSGEIEADADTIMFLYRDEEYNPGTVDKGVAEIHVAKQRQGSTGTVGCAFIGQYTRFADLEYRWSPSEPEKKSFQSRGLD